MTTPISLYLLHVKVDIEYISVMIPYWKKVCIIHNWSELIFDPEQLFQGQVNCSGASVANSSSAEAAQV